MRKIVFWFWTWTRPRSVRKLCCKLPPWHIYMIKPTAQIAEIYSYSEDETVTVNILPDNEQPFTSGTLGAEGYQVFGYKPDDLERVLEGLEQKNEN